MVTAAHTVPVLTLRPLRRGAAYTRSTQGGCIRDRAPSAGFAWEAGEACGFIALGAVQLAMVDLKLAQEKRP